MKKYLMVGSVLFIALSAFGSIAPAEQPSVDWSDSRPVPDIIPAPVPAPVPVQAAPSYSTGGYRNPNEPNWLYHCGGIVHKFRDTYYIEKTSLTSNACWRYMIYNWNDSRVFFNEDYWRANWREAACGQKKNCFLKRA